jgi:quinol monooxygenase YgiN
VDEDTPSTAEQGGVQVSVIMTLRVAGDPDKLEQHAAENADMIRGISQRAKEQGLIAHRFYGSEGQIMVVDEWPDPQSFQRFFESEQANIGPMMEQVATSEPEITFWRKLETGDDIGWE